MICTLRVVERRLQFLDILCALVPIYYLLNWYIVETFSVFCAVYIVNVVATINVSTSVAPDFESRRRQTKLTLPFPSPPSAPPPLRPPLPLLFINHPFTWQRGLAQQAQRPPVASPSWPLSLPIQPGNHNTTADGAQRRAWRTRRDAVSTWRRADKARGRGWLSAPPPTRPSVGDTDRGLLSMTPRLHPFIMTWVSEEMDLSP